MQPQSVPLQPYTTLYRHFKPGSLLLTYNWRGWQKPLDQNWTNRLTSAQLQDLHAGDQVWLKRDEIGGEQVYGFQLIQVVRLTASTGDSLEVCYTTGGECGCHTIMLFDPATWLYELTNENAVYNWTLNHRYARRIA
ncbi:hypothetical protein KC906_03045 [Candidatus Kaiserbacteria bacterium]|nr:hypothetical protein [Candidatus Kaiserbacteria bacterium]MCB9812669.1 hypothetical protein [Candidatus Nomurabacteria bacterium]